MNPEEELKTAELLKGLFRAQGKFCDDELILFFLDGIKKWPYSQGAIELGIKSLYDEKMKEVNLPDIKKSVELRIDRNIEKRVKCKYCDGTGIVPMTDGTYSPAFGCICEAGDDFIKYQNLRKNVRVLRWNGRESQFAGNKEYRYCYPDTLGGQ